MSNQKTGVAQSEDEDKTRCVVIEKPRYVEADEFTPYDEGQWRKGLRVVEREYGGVYIERFDRWGEPVEHVHGTKNRIVVHDRQSDLLGSTLVDFEGQWRITGGYLEEWDREQADGPKTEVEA